MTQAGAHELLVVRGEFLCRGRRAAPFGELLADRSGMAGGAGDGHDLHRAPAAAEGGPEGLVGLPPVAEGVEVPTPGDGVHEGCGALVGGDRKRDGEVAAGGRDGAPEAALGEVGGRNAEARETGDLLLFRGEPREGGVLDDVVEGKQAAEKKVGGVNAPVADMLDVERPVEGARGDVAPLFARTSTVRSKGAFTRGRGLEKALHEAMSGGKAATLLEYELGAEEDATMEANEGEPGGLPPGPAERFEGGLAASQVGDGGHGR